MQSQHENLHHSHACPRTHAQASITTSTWLQTKPVYRGYYVSKLGSLNGCYNAYEQDYDVQGALPRAFHANVEWLRRFKEDMLLYMWKYKYKWWVNNQNCICDKCGLGPRCLLRFFKALQALLL